MSSKLVKTWKVLSDLTSLHDIAQSTNQGGWTGFKGFECVLIYISDFWGYFWSPAAIKISTDSLEVLHDPIIFVSRSGKFTLFYIAYVTHIAEITYDDHTVKIDISSF